MATEIRYTDPLTVREVTLSAGVNMITFPGLPQDGIVTMAPSADDAAYIADIGDDGDAHDAARSFPLFSGGTNQLQAPGLGVETGTPRVRISDAVGGTVVRFLLTRAR